MKQPVYLRDNAYAGNATPYEMEARATLLPGDITIGIVEDGDRVHLETVFPTHLDAARVGLLTGSELEPVRFAAAHFEEPDGSPVAINTDLLGITRTKDGEYALGPIAALRSGATRTRIW